MNNINNLFKISNDVKSLNLKNFNIAMEDKEFANLVYRLDMPKEEIVKYTTKLESTVRELKNCKNCKNLKTCLNDVGMLIFLQKRVMLSFSLILLVNIKKNMINIKVMLFIMKLLLS